MNFNTIPDDQTYLRPKKATTSNLKGRLVGEVAGPKGTGTANGQDYYGVDADEGCKPETALACGTVECKA